MAKKTEAQEKTKAKRSFAADKTSTQFGNTELRRPSKNPDMPPAVIDAIERSLNEIRNELEQYAVHMRPLDRRRLNRVGIKKQGFIQRTFEYVMENPELLPRYLTEERLRKSHDYFIRTSVLNDLCKQIKELLCNIKAKAADMDYTNALDFYAAAREAAKRRVDGTETIYNDLETFFKHKKPADAKPTKKETLRNAGALMKGKRSGKINIENVKPKLTGGKHTVIDEQFEDTAHFQETEEGGKNL